MADPYDEILVVDLLGGATSTFTGLPGCPHRSATAIAARSADNPVDLGNH